MEEMYNRHYIELDDRGCITSGWSDGPAPHRDTSGAVCINDKGGYQFRLKFADGSLSEENPALFAQALPIPLYRFDGLVALPRSEEEIRAEADALPQPEQGLTASERLDELEAAMSALLTGEDAV